MRIEERETQVLLSLLACEFFDGELPNAIDVDWEKLLKAANDHVITALLYSGIKRLKGVPEQIVSRVRSAAISSAMQSEHMLQIQQEVIAALDNEQILCAVLKGTSVACCYPHPELRIPGDIDLLVGSANLDAACCKLKDIGFMEDHDTKMHAGLRRSDTEVELHRMSSVFPDTEKGVWTAAYMDQALQYVRQETLTDWEFPVLSKSYQLISLLAHMSCHMGSSGIGLRQLCDWAVTVHRLRGDIVQEDVELLERCGLLRYAGIMTRICEKYLGLPACAQFGDAPEELVDAVMEDILAVGNFHAQQGKRTMSAVMMNRQENLNQGKSWVVVNYIHYVCRRVKQSYSWAKSPLWIPLFCVYFPAQWLVRVFTGRRKMVSISEAIQTAKSRERLLQKMELYR